MVRHPVRGAQHALQCEPAAGQRRRWESRIGRSIASKPYAGTCAARGIEDIVAIGSEFDDRRPSPWWRNLHGLPIKVVAALLHDATLVVTLENGIGHLAHGVDAPIVMIYSNIVPLGWANPVEANRCQVLVRRSRGRSRSTP